MIVLGLTGSIGMGKTTVASQFMAQGVAVCNADDIVHRLLAKGGDAVEEVGRHFPEALINGEINRKALGNIVFHHETKRLLLESILHPMVVAEENAFLEEQRGKNAAFAVLEIPLLFETGAQSRCDKVVVVTAPAFIQKKRVMARPGMTLEKFHAIVALQTPDMEKRKRADFLVHTGWGRAYSAIQVKCILRRLSCSVK